MVNTALLTALAASALLSTPVSGAIYLKSSPVLQLDDAKAYERLIAKSNHTSIVEFYAPWCGHCQSLKPAYEKAAKNLAGLAKVAAVNCDEESNKPFCGSMGVKGFPTLKIVKPSKKTGKPVVEDYQGARTAKGIVDAVVDKIPNHVQRIADKALDGFLTESDGPKGILFTEKGTTSALLRALAIDYLGVVQIAQVRNTQKAAIERFDITTYPTFIIIPGNGQEHIVYDGDMKKEALSKFVSQVAEPNPDPAPAGSKKDKKAPKKDKKASSDSSSFSKSSASQKSAESATAVTLEDEAVPTEATDPETLEDLQNEKPIELNLPPALTELEHAPVLEEKCTQYNSQSCLLVLLPQKPLDDPDAPFDPQTATALGSLAEIQHKHHQRKGNLFPFFAIPAFNSKGIELRRSTGLDKDEKRLEVLLVNAKRNWYKRYAGNDFTQAGLEDWIDQVRMGEGKKERLPEGIVSNPPEEPIVPEDEPVVEEVVVEEEVVQDEAKVQPDHDEL